MEGNIVRRFHWALGPQIMVGLIVAVFFVAGIGSMMQARAALLTDIDQTAQSLSKQRIEMKRQAKQYAWQNYLAGTYSWISPVDCKVEHCIALTFDDGPNPITTPAVLRILEREQITASFFVVGSRVHGNESLLKRMVADGDEIGNHSWSHPDFTTLKPDQIKKQIMLTQRAVEAAGVPTPTLFRPPYGNVDKKVVVSTPLTMMFWNEDPRDWAADSPDQVVHAVLSSAKPGGVIDMHDIYAVTADSLGPIIKNLKAHKYKFVTASQLLGLKPGQRGLYYGRP
ncbi:MAG TPA: polysaccharide deacetylase family protein [Candidatus Saccharimonadales bacterium]|nr:polysaccharide deacetylase family protein [Candidatus Saccharimonadales bacterium]